MVTLKNCSLAKMQEIFSGRRVYGYGAGTYLDKFRKRNAEANFEKCLYKLVDNKIGQKKIGEKVFDVISLDELRGSIRADDIIVITTSYYYVEIIETLDAYAEFEGVAVYILPFIENCWDECKIDWELYFGCRNETEVIPRIIHYCWFGDNEIPSELKKYMKSWKKFCPDYEIICWSEANYDIKKNQYVYEAYKNKKWAFVSDYVRIDVVNQYGGVYLDTDVELVRSIDELLHFNGFMGFENTGLVASGLGFGSVKNNVILEEFLKYYQNRRFVNERGELDLTPCPYIETNVLEKLGLKKNNQLQRLAEDFMILPTVFLGGMNLGTRLVEITENTYAVHHYAGTWVDASDNILKRRKDAGEWLMRRINDACAKVRGAEI